jgi:DNA-binding LacI/PurR family transcriptional regulator
VDGILVITPQEQSAEALLHAPWGDTPLVAVEAGPEAVPVVAIDQVAGAAAATRHLLELGHETVWHITGPLDFLESQQRMHGWRTTLEQAGAEVPSPLVGDWSPRAGYDLGQQLSSDRSVTAIFVANDQMALGVLRAMHQAGREVPAQLSIVGFDDIPEAAFFAPPLTTVRQDFAELGRRAVARLVALVEGRELSFPEPVAPALIVRESA